MPNSQLTVLRISWSILLLKHGGDDEEVLGNLWVTPHSAKECSLAYGNV
ncbi:hypothetical protein BofuT4_P137170.1 [Botrytis cinerea T4]|uniref:Uncharacterized protein n=1 Tax=Botryotinia fuckeliana (strain T4) TaxID=999810 RepID=G2YPX4_BOTF4|nr:hypothetical protein BofuT4_P137170.1 [Botrytis cinerea T4]